MKLGNVFARIKRRDEENWDRTWRVGDQNLVGGNVLSLSLGANRKVVDEFGRAEWKTSVQLGRVYPGIKVFVMLATLRDLVKSRALEEGLYDKGKIVYYRVIDEEQLLAKSAEGRMSK